MPTGLALIGISENRADPDPRIGGVVVVQIAIVVHIGEPRSGDQLQTLPCNFFDSLSYLVIGPTPLFYKADFAVD